MPKIKPSQHYRRLYYGSWLPDLVAKGMSIAEIALEGEFSYTTVCKALKQRGLTTKRGRVETSAEPAKDLRCLRALAIWPTAVIREAVRLDLIELVDINEIATILGRSRAEVDGMFNTAYGRSLRRYVFGRDGGRRSVNDRAPLRQAACEMIAEGVLPEEIHRIIEIPVPTIMSWVKDLVPELKIRAEFRLIRKETKAPHTRSADRTSPMAGGAYAPY